jgi:hypothetical protein
MTRCVGLPAEDTRQPRSAPLGRAGEAARREMCAQLARPLAVAAAVTALCAGDMQRRGMQARWSASSSSRWSTCRRTARSSRCCRPRASSTARFSPSWSTDSCRLRARRGRGPSGRGGSPRETHLWARGDRTGVPPPGRHGCGHSGRRLARLLRAAARAGQPHRAAQAGPAAAQPPGHWSVVWAGQCRHSRPERVCRRQRHAPPGCSQPTAVSL